MISNAMKSIAITAILTIILIRNDDWYLIESFKLIKGKIGHNSNLLIVRSLPWYGSKFLFSVLYTISYILVKRKCHLHSGWRLSFISKIDYSRLIHIEGSGHIIIHWSDYEERETSKKACTLAIICVKIPNGPTNGNKRSKNHCDFMR